MVITRSQSRKEARSLICTSNGSKDDAPGVVGDDNQNSTQERLGRGCRIPREPPASYDSMYVRKALLPSVRRRAEHEELQINSRYPQRDAAKRAVLRMSSTLHSLGERTRRNFWPLEDDNGDGDDESSSNDGSEDGSASFQSLGRKCNGNRFTNLSRKRVREPSINSFITDDSLREGSNGRGKDADEELLVEDPSSLSSAEGCISEGEGRRVFRKAKESTVKHIPINHYLDEVMKASEKKTKKGDKQKGKTHRRRMEDMFLGLNEAHGGPVGAGKGGEGRSMTETPAPLGDITPLHIDTSVSFEKVGGLPGHIVMLREMVLFPLLYPHLLQTMNLTPPRGVLFVGPPGTGKTLMARALANEAASCAQRKIAFFMRKGADILSKWVGESERQLSLLFEEARRRQPSIIFFDEIDGLVPVRHAKAEQSQAALVSTLLALIDGLDDRGQVIVIGATNRPDTIDPALRRPGRLDRELYFPLPDAAARRHILSIVTQPILPLDHPDRNAIMEELATRCEGWSGAEIQALCTEAGLNRLRTSLPQLYVTSRRLQIPNNALTIQKEDFFVAAQRFKTSVRRGTESIVKGLEEHLEHLLYSTRMKLLSHVASMWPSAATALANERRDCSNASDAVRELIGFPIPHTVKPMLLFLTSSVERNLYGVESYEFALEKAALAFIKALPSIRIFTLNLPNLVVDRGSAPMMVTATGSAVPEGGAGNFEELGFPLNNSFTSGHIYSCIMAIQRSSGPSLVLLQGLDLWLAEYGYPITNEEGNEGDGTDEERTQHKKQMESFCYYLALLRDSDVLIVAPTLHCDVLSRFFGGTRLNTQIHKTVGNVPCAPSVDDLQRFLQYVFHVVELALLHCTHTVWEELHEDISPPPPPSMEEVRAARHGTLELWRRVEYRRRQLRYVLSKWLGQYLVSRKFSILCSADLDFTPSHDLYDEWRQHTQGSRIGLCDVMEKLENEEYTSLSQYHDDIDMLVRNVRTFFRTRSSTDQRYRSRALELKETTVLNLYKINRNVVQFCEQYKDLAEPDVSLSSLSPNDDVKPRIEEPTESRAVQSTVKGKRKPYRYYRDRRRRRRRVRKTPKVRENDNLHKIGDENEEETTREEGRSANRDELKTEPAAPEALPRDEEEVDDHAVIVERNGINSSDFSSSIAQCDKAAEIRVSMEMLRGLSFLELHGVFQAAMSLLEEEVSRRRNQQQTVSVSPFTGTSEVGSTSFFLWMLEEAVRAAVKERRTSD
ncbi:hypothetical protein ECC02_002943 [Trypanosoma cruzi]|uniref:AAA+ ATPase domain-containing protein n=1 Tax=Trypanosoma cruzi TaxID=5693 RepID=A0A7J6YD66_TRYCR|nr:hypothetical protein ECC02_002943 [Trypanosoma cruzi]